MTAEYPPEIEAISARIPPELGQAIECDEGWFALLAELNARLSHLDPDYLVTEVKEKFGTLRFMAETTRRDEIGVRFDGIIAAAEAASSFLCEACGAIGGIAQKKSWWKTLCDEHAAADGFKRPRGS